MRIGIVTVFDAVNYGSFLQAFALQETIKQLEPDAEVKMIKTSSFLYEKWRFTSLFSYNPKKIPFKFTLLKKYCSAWRKFSVTYKKKGYDLLIIGSDEMWQLKNKTLKPLEEFFGVGIDAKKKITYAVSCNNTTSEDIRKHPYIAENINKLDAISIRDDATAIAYSPLIEEKEYSMVIDPTLLLDMEQYAVYPDEEGYLLVYSYQLKPEMISVVKEYAKKHHLKIYCIGQNFTWCDKQIPASPFEFLGYIKNAKIVFTDTFHGTVLSIALKKDFWVFASHKVKVRKIIEQLGLMGRNISGVKSGKEIVDQPVDYESVYESLAILREESRAYLKKWVTDEKLGVN